MKIEHPLPGDIVALRALWKEAFGDPDSYLDLFFTTAFFPDHCLCVRDNGIVRAAAYWMDCQIGQQTAAYIYAVATAENSRGRGLCRTLMENLHDVLKTRGYCGAILVPGSDSLRQMYGAMGYRDFGGIREFSCTTGDAAAHMQKIDRTEFAALRRQYLPENAVIQEGAQLPLLDAVAEFYRGDDFLVALSRETRHVLELLGDEAAAGFYETDRHLFAMYRPLTDEFFPTYFAFAFD